MPEITAALAQADDAGHTGRVYRLTPRCAIRWNVRRLFIAKGGGRRTVRRTRRGAHRSRSLSPSTRGRSWTSSRERTAWSGLLLAFPVHASPVFELGGRVFVRSWCARHRQQLPGKWQGSWHRRDLPRRHAPVGRAGVRPSRRSGEGDQRDGTTRPATRAQSG